MPSKRVIDGDDPREEYIGDGVYASHDGWYLWLDIRGQSDCKIGLEPACVDRLNKYQKYLKQFYQQKHGGPPVKF